MSEKLQPSEQYFAVLAEVEGHEKPLLLFKLTFARLIDDVIFPYETGKPFFVDGVSVSKEKTNRLKILQLKESFDGAFYLLNRTMNHGPAETRKIYGEQYHTRVEAIFRDDGEDVTSQVISAFDKTIKPRLNDYLPNKETLIQAAWSLFILGLKQLAGSNPTH